jgi:hypothetical protein
MTNIVKVDELFSRSAGRFLTEAQLQPDPALVADGWERRFTADSQRAAEAIELYTQLGYEVRVESLRPEEITDECEGCHSLAALEFKTIYTRKKKD